MKVIKNTNGSYTLIDNENNEIILKTIMCHDREFVRLPDGFTKKHISVKAFEKVNEVELQEGEPTKKSTTKTEKTTSKAPKLNELVELLTEEERKIYKDLMDRAAKRLADKKKVDKIAELKAEVARLEAEINGENEEA